MMDKEKILRILQKRWDEYNELYSEDGFKEYVEDYCENNFHDGYFLNDDGETEYIVDWVLQNLDLRR